MVCISLSAYSQVSYYGFSGSVLVSGSNPHPDAVMSGTKFPTEYRVEIFYPSYFNARRPQPSGIPSQIGYGGPFFNISLSATDLSNDVQKIQNTSATCIRPGFSTHAMNMNQRMLVFESSYTGNADGSATLHVSPFPPNPALFPPGPCLFFVVVDGVPSVAVQVMVGSGVIEEQTAVGTVPLPQSKIVAAADTSKSSSTAAEASGTGKPSMNAAVRMVGVSGYGLGLMLPAVLVGMALLVL